MPITDDEFDAGTVDENADADPDEDPIETEKDLILSFLSERVGQAFTEREIVLGVDFSPVYADRSGTTPGSRAVGAVTGGLVDVAGDAAASAIVVDDVDEALAQLVEGGAVQATEVDEGDGETATYYRISD
ncbi:hypothetical protein [Halobaculum lipolyticum]|uniref:Uncharacterized protein n=1 Tax=Halobaculum lipolyticum TaxID=3032001 RepID=A0ABD5WCM5_9EURY|nr:hypothetical protein [Halobaculum sp. DT31]